jgi:hypothetical protein
MNTPKNENAGSAEQRPEEKTVRGSGYTYTEKQERSDVSTPIEQVPKDDIVVLPDLGPATGEGPEIGQ